MGFMRRKSLAAAEGEEARVRNRLSKPMTSKSPTSQKVFAGKQSPKSISQHTSVSSQLSLEQIARTMSKKESRAHLRSHLFEDQEDVRPVPPAKDVPIKTGVASLVKQFESAASASRSTLTTSTQLSKNNSLTHGSQSLSETQQQQPSRNSRSKEQLRLHKHSSSNIASPTDTLDILLDPFAIPKRRESTYRPGEATRKPSIEDKENVPPVPKEEKQEPDFDKPLPSVQITEDFEQVPEQWTPPPPPNRTETPMSLDFKAIGNLRLGSLHVVNGRTSPVLSELSRVLISQRLRDVSSEYADSTYSKDRGSEAWEDADVMEDADDQEPDEIATPCTPSRITHDTVTHQLSTPVNNPQTPEQSVVPTPNGSMESPDKTSQIAESYMKELRGSPFSFGSSSPLSTGSVVHYQEEYDDSATSEGTHHVYEKGNLILSDAEQLNEIDNHSSPVELEQLSIEDKPSEVGTVSTRNQVFSSALEYQAPVFHPPPSPERTISPESLQSHAFNNRCEKVDSGYNSGTSLVSLNMHDTKTRTKQMPLHVDTTPIQARPVLQDGGSKDVSPKKERSPRKLGRFFHFRPAVSRSPVSAPAVPTTANIRPESSVAVANTTVTAVSPPQASPNPSKDNDISKSQKRLHKDRPHSRAQSKVRESKEIIVQRLASCESTLDIPAIPDMTRASLHLRCQQIPELERTFRSHNHTGVHPQPSMSTLTTANEEIRFPSPYPDSEDELQLPQSTKKDRDRSRSRRSRSKSRRRSLLDYMFRSDKDTERREPESSRVDTEVSIADFGDVIHSLGANPYDIAHSRPHTPEASSRKIAGPRTNPSVISTSKATKRLSMTDEEASEYARMRSHSFNGYDDRAPRKHHLSDRGGLPGRHIRQSLIETDVPPIPPLPNNEEIRRMSLRHSVQSPYTGTPDRVQQFWEGSPSSERYPESSPAPMPPAHSPRPSFVDHNFEEEYAVEDDLDLAPPPPSHSPVPMDVSVPTRSRSRSPLPRGPYAEHGSRSPWDAQARAWQERRTSAGERLRSHRESLDMRGVYSYDESAIDDDDAPIYPVIPPRHPGRMQQFYQEPDQWVSGGNDYGDYDHDYNVRRSQTWDDRTHDPYRFDHRRSQYSGSSFQNRQQRYNTWDQSESYGYEAGTANTTHRPVHESRQSNHKSQASNDSRQSFYSHHNCPIDRPFDPPPRWIEDEDEDLGHHGYYYTPQASPIRGRERSRQEYDYSQPNGYERQYDPRLYSEHRTSENQYNHQTHNIPRRPVPTRQQQPRVKSRSPHPSSLHSHHASLLPLSPSISRPTSRQSLRSNGSAVSLAEELHPEINTRPSQAPDYGRYSGGMNYGYEGRNKGFGGSAGTRSVSGKADAMFKGTELRGSHGVDLGDVPVIGLMKKI